LTDAGAFGEMLIRDKYRTVILHGHHHSRFHGTLKVGEKSVATVVSASSTLLGAESWAKDEPVAAKTLSFDMLHLTCTGGDVALRAKPKAVVF
jgi:hypothetical protein